VKRYGLNNVVELPGRPKARPEGTAPSRRARRIVAVGGGKGGIGKSLVSANLGIALARAGHRVILADVDLGGANLHTCLGMTQPQATLSDVVTRGPASRPSPSDGHRQPPLGLRRRWMRWTPPTPGPGARARLVAEPSRWTPTTSSSTSARAPLHTIDFFFLRPRHGVLVLLPEPTSVENAYLS
jgi:flagellar biosynthesis protein FlhG